MTPEYKHVAGWPHYEVSRGGDIRKVGGPALGQWLNDHGYVYVRFSRPRKMIRVHRIVAAAFVENPNNLPFINHLNNSRSDNRAANLEWCSQKENLAHARRQGRMPSNYWRGKRSPNARLSDSQVVEIRTLYSAGRLSWEAIGKKFGMSKRAIGRIVRRETYV